MYTHTHTSFFHKHQYIDNARTTLYSPNRAATQAKDPDDRPAQRPVPGPPSPEQLRTAAAAPPPCQHGTLTSERTTSRCVKRKRPENSETSTNANQVPHVPALPEVPASKQRPRAAVAPGSSRSPSVRMRGLTDVVPESRMQWDPGPLEGRILVATAECRTGSVWVCQRAALLLSGRGVPSSQGLTHGWDWEALWERSAHAY